MNRKRLLIDTNLLVLLVVGLVDRGAIATHKRTRTYSDSDFVLLASILDQFERIVVPSYVVAEASNLLAQTGNQELRESLLLALAELVKNGILGAEIRERQITIAQLSNLEVVASLGVTDAAIVDQRKIAVLSDDEGVCWRLRQKVPDQSFVVYFPEQRLREY